MDSEKKLIIRKLEPFMNENYFSSEFRDKGMLNIVNKEIKSIKIIKEDEIPSIKSIFI